MFRVRRNDPASNEPWVDGDVQRLGLFTDAAGRFTMPRVPAGKIGVIARLGSRKVDGEVQTGGSLLLRIRK